MNVPEAKEEAPAVYETSDPFSAFTAVMDAFTGTSNDETPEERAEETAPDESADGLPAAASEATGGNDAPTGSAASGDGERPPLSDDGGSESLGNESAPGLTAGIDASSLTDTFAEISTKIETNIRDSMLEEALVAVRNDYGNYFDALEKHPRMLVGQEVPSLVGEGMEVLRDSTDAKEWQEAVKTILSKEIQQRADVRGEELNTTFETLHASVDLFKNNPDLIPGTKQFNRGLADSFTKLVKDYEVRNDAGKLIGYAVPVQPLINSLRSQQKAVAPAAAPAAAKPVAPAAAPAAPAAAPQAGIRSNAGSAGGGDSSSDFSTLFGTLGLPDMVI